MSIVSLGDGTFIDTVSQLHLAGDGTTLSRLDEVERVPAGGKKIRGRTGIGEQTVSVSDIAHKVATMAHRRQADALGRPVLMRDADGDSIRVHAMDLGMGDVHIPGQMAGAAAGYRSVSGIADMIAPVVPSQHQKDSIPIWDKENAFARAKGTTTAPGGEVPETSISLSTTPFSTKARALSFILPVEVIENADSPLRPWETGGRVCQDRLAMEREHRVCAAAVTAASWDSTVVFDLGASFGWATGASADPVKDIDTAVLASVDTTDLSLIMTERTFMSFQRSPAVQKFIAYKSGVGPRPSDREMSAILTLPPIVVQKMKTQNTSGSTLYVLEQEATALSKTGAVILVKNSPGLSDPSQISTMKTIRWNGGSTPDGTMVAGWMVRTYFDQKKGPRGSYVMVVCHNDDEIFTSKFIGGLITGTDQ